MLPASWDVQFTSDWDGPMDGQTIDPGNLPGFGLYRWEIPSDNPWWSRPLKLGEIGCAISHWLCWQRAAADGADPALILEDDAVLTRHCAERLQARLARLTAIDPRWDLVYLGRWALDGEDRPVTAGIVRPGYSYCTYGYLLSPSGLRGGARLRFRARADPGRRADPGPLPGSPARGHPVAVPQAAAGLRLRAGPGHPAAEGAGRKRHRGQRLRAEQRAPGRQPPDRRASSTGGGGM